MHGREGEERKRRRHMWPVPAPGTAPAAQSLPAVVAAADSSHPFPDSILKDGRKIRVGDCALFQAGNAPPFIGIIRSFTTCKEGILKVCVNWLYRPADVKLAKGILLEAAPNEVFYSFHKDENISAASLLHPCKVAFLRKGVELPSGICSFVCRRVYDIDNKCLWWLTDQDYINERQEEVDQLLDKTRLEMHAAVQSGGRSPKPLNGPTSTQQLKSGSDSVQNSGTSFASQVKGKKRERGDQVPEPIKRERSFKQEDGDSVNFRLDNMIKAEIDKITDKGGLINTEGVEKLVHLMQLDRPERKIDFAGRVLLADVIAATERLDCLGKFVQLRGVPVLDDWLQEAHKGKTGDGSSPKESDKSVEEFLLALLRALDKLPVNLNALQTCHIGKSVNNLRSHKNLEIQKKARSLVDTWKKRVDAEMNKINDAKSVGSSQAVSWQSKPGFSELSHGGNRRAGSTEVNLKSPVTQPSSCKNVPAKFVHGDAIVKSTPTALGSSKVPSALPASVAINSKDTQHKVAGSSGISELPMTTVKEEKSSSSSQSQNNSQSCSSDHAKTMGSSWKEDARSSTAGSMNSCKISGGSLRNRKPSNGFLGTGVSGILKETNLGKSGSLNRTTTLDKVSQSGLIYERTLDMPVSDQGNSHRLIVRLPNPGRSPSRSASGGPFDDPIVGSRASSPGVPDKHDQNDRKQKVKDDACQAHSATDVNTESWQTNDVKDVVGSDGCDGSPAALPDKDCSKNADETGKSTDAVKVTCSSLGNEKGVYLTEPKGRRSYEASFSSINALIESCAKYSEANDSLLAGDDLGMNLLASVAAGEMSKSDLVSPPGSPESSPSPEVQCTGNEAKSRLSSDDAVAQSHGHPNENADADSERHVKCGDPVVARDEPQQTGMNLSDPCIKSEEKLGEERADGSLSVSTSLAEVKERSEGDGANQRQDNWNAGGQFTDSPSDCKSKGTSPSSNENKSVNCTLEKIAEGRSTSDFVCNSLGDGGNIDNAASGRKPEKVVEESPSCPSLNTDVKTMNSGDEGFSGATSTEQQLAPVAAIHAEAVDRSGDDAVASSSAGDILDPENVDESNIEKSDGLLVGGHLEPSDSERKEHTGFSPSPLDDRTRSVFSLSTGNVVEEILERKEVLEHHPAGSASHEEPHTIPAQETERYAKSLGSKLSGTDADENEEPASSAEAASLAITAGPDIAGKLDFDLNEGFPGDEGNQGEPVVLAAPVSSSTLHLPSLSPFAASPLSSGSPALITVAAPAKGPFVPPENLLKSKGEPGWKGSAATSAFRPAEPRKLLEMPLSNSDVPSSDGTAGKQGRPPLDIDLNVPDERVLEDMASQSSTQSMGSESDAISNRDASMRNAGGLDLDLNRVDESADNGHFFGSTRRLEVPLLPIRPSPGGFPNEEANALRDFDLNNGPGLDEVGVEHAPRSQHAKSSSMPFLPPIPGLRMNNAELGNMSSWFPSGNSYPAVIPSFLPDRGDQPYPIVAAAGAQRLMGSATGGSTYGGDIYRGPVLSSSPAMAFSPTAAFPYAGFPFGSSYPLTSTSFSGPGGPATYVDSSSGGGPCFAAVPSQLVGPAGGVSSHYGRPFMISLAEGSTSGSESSRKWGRQSLDLNAGPGGADMEGREERLPSLLRQPSVANSQAFVDDHTRIYQVLGAGSKRKEPEPVWDAERFAYK